MEEREGKERRAETKEEEKRIEIFRDFLKIETLSFYGPQSGSYREAVKFLGNLCQEKGLENIREVEIIKGKPILLATWPGSDPELKAILLNGHYDVVPAVLEEWNTDPFSAHFDKETGRIYGRGTQDMKSVCIQYILAVGKLIEEGFKPLRTFHLSFVPDEEIGGKEGMATFVLSDHFKELNIGVSFDEGLANPENAFTIFHGERTARKFYVTAKGPTGHGSRFIPETAIAKLLKFCDKALEYRKEQEEELGYQGVGCAHAQSKKLGDVTTVNLTMLRAGVTCDEGKTYSLNVIPTEATAGFDMRVSPNVSLESVLGKLDEWAKEAGDDVSWSEPSLYKPMQKHYVTSIEKENFWWPIVYDCLVKETGKPLIPEIFPAATDSRYIRECGIPAFGFSPMANTPILLHDHNEFIDSGVFLEGVEIFEKLIKQIGSVPKNPSE